MKDLDSVKIEDLLPASLKADKTVNNAASAIDPSLKALVGELELPALYAQLERLHGKQLDHIAYGWNATVWRDTWPDELKRSIIRNVTREKRVRGTVKAVKEALSSIGSAARIVEWWQTTPKGEPHTFQVIVTQPEHAGTIEAELQEDVIALLDDAKPLRSHYTFTIQRVVRAQLGINATIRPAVYARVKGGQ